MLKNNTVNPLKLVSTIEAIWSPHIIAQVDDMYVKVVKLKGELVWHQHQHEDEMFMVLSGCLKIAFDNHCISLNAGDVYVVEKGVMHNPIAEEECLVLLIEKASTMHTGNVVNQYSKSLRQQLASIKGC